MDSLQSQSIGNVQHERWLWFAQTFESARGTARMQRLSAQALLTEVDLQIAFCAGAWISTIVLAFAAIEAHVRQIDTDDFQTNVAKLIDVDPELVWLRDIRNELMHSHKPGSPSMIWMVHGHDIASTHKALEADAKRAVTAMLRFIYGKHKV